MDGASSGVRYLSDEDCFFLENVMIDIRSYINTLNVSSNEKKVLLFPPVNNFRRFLVHKLVEETFHKDNLATLSIGKLYGRRTVVFAASLKSMENNDDHVVTTKNLTHVNEDSKKKSSSVPIYRPPAVRKRENIARNSILKDGKTRKPDIQIYVPRAKRLSQSEQPIESPEENKFNEEMDTKSKRTNVKNIDDDIQFLGIVKRADKENSSDLSSSPTEEKNRKDTFLSRFPNEESIGFKTKNKSTPENKKPDPPSENVALEEAPSEIEDESSCDSIIEITSTSTITDDSLSCSDKQDLSEFSVKSKVPVPVTNSKTEKAGSSQSKNLDVESCDWEELFDDSGEYVDERLIDELMSAIGKVSVQRATQDYRSFQTEEERSSDGESIIEVYGFPAEFRTEDLFNVFTAYRTDRGFQIVWVDDTHALAVFSSPIMADEVLNSQLPFVKTRPLKQAIAKSKIKANNFVLPPVTRPKTCVSLARRLVSGHLGMKINVTAKQREAERKLLSDAREQKRLLAKQKVDAWEGTSSSSGL